MIPRLINIPMWPMYIDGTNKVDKKYIKYKPEKRQ